MLFYAHHLLNELAAVVWKFSLDLAPAQIALLSGKRFATKSVARPISISQISQDFSYRRNEMTKKLSLWRCSVYANNRTGRMSFKIIANSLDQLQKICDAAEHLK